MCEVHVLATLADAQLSLHDFDFKNSIVKLHQAKRHLDSWLRLLSRSQTNLVVPENTILRVYTALHNIHKLLCSKSTLLFYELLSSPELGPKPESLDSRAAPLSVDHFQRLLIRAQQVLSATFISLHITTQGTKYKPQGYSLPSTPFEPVQGLSSIPSVFCAPSPAELTLPHKVVIASILSRLDTDGPPKVIQYDEAQELTLKNNPVRDKRKFAYYFCQADTRVHLVMALLVAKKGIERSVDKNVRRLMLQFCTTFQSSWQLT
eukprot:m.77311 g.77311  ORF g.77311 m.77311 type:complete len:263 (+) comp20670_c0_seq3:771-1559(+)